MKYADGRRNNRNDGFIRIYNSAKIIFRAGTPKDLAGSLQHADPSEYLRMTRGDEIGKLFRPRS
jgi:hypothetical protein